MTALPFYQVDAFAEEVFTGNPAVVIPLEAWLPDDTLLAIAAEHNLSETAFIVRNTVDTTSDYELRWFTPTCEVTLCGHATLAAAHTLFEELHWHHPHVTFSTRHAGNLTVLKQENTYWMDFPARPVIEPLPLERLGEALNGIDAPAFCSEEDWLVELPNEATVRDFEPNAAAIAGLPCRGLIVTAKADIAQPYDVVSRFFCPSVGINEDPVTGSAHCVIAPYWADKLGKAILHCFQASARGGNVMTRLVGPRVQLGGQAVTYSMGQCHVPVACPV